MNYYCTISVWESVYFFLVVPKEPGKISECVLQRADLAFRVQPEAFELLRNDNALFFSQEDSTAEKRGLVRCVEEQELEHWLDRDDKYNYQWKKVQWVKP